MSQDVASNAINLATPVAYKSEKCTGTTLAAGVWKRRCYVISDFSRNANDANGRWLASTSEVCALTGLSIWREQQMPLARWSRERVWQQRRLRQHSHGVSRGLFAMERKKFAEEYFQMCRRRHHLPCHRRRY